MERPYMEKENPSTPISNGKGEYYTGNKSKKLLVHIMQKGIEVDKPVKSKIYAQNVSWNKRQWAVVPERFIFDYSGVAHQYVDVNDVSALTWKKDHEDKCRQCGGKMTVDARESRALGRRGVFHAIWGLDNTHTILLIVMFIGIVGMAGAFVWAYTNDTKHATQLTGAEAKIKEQTAIIGQYQNATGLIIGRDLR